jgi:two-component system cell cycle response regulator CpdR
MTRLLEGAGHKVWPVSDGLEAAHALKTKKCDLLLTDIVMPGMDGMQLAKVAWQNNPEMKVMFVSGFASVAKQDKEYPKNKACLLSKPFNLRELVAEVGRITGAETHHASEEGHETVVDLKHRKRKHKGAH